MNEILQTSLFISLFTCGVYYLSLKSWPLYFYRKLIYWVFGVVWIVQLDEFHYQHEWSRPIIKVLINCPPCMCSFYGIGLSFWLYYFGFNNDMIISELIFYPLSVFLAGALNRLIILIIE